jgi:hypothetical protein
MPLIELETFGGFRIVWPAIRLTMLVDPWGECWLVLCGKPLSRHQIPAC